MRYTSMGLQMVSYVLIMALLGYKLDQWVGTTRPYFLAGCALAGCIFAMIYLIKATFKQKD
ncbi:MAG: AtpZ/AtpI family protein [Sphingobacteriia bacterium]